MLLLSSVRIRRNWETTGLMSIPGKVKEQLILEVISRHMKDKEIIRSSQQVFRECQEIISLIDEGRAVDTVFLDFSQI